MAGWFAERARGDLAAVAWSLVLGLAVAVAGGCGGGSASAGTDGGSPEGSASGAAASGSSGGGSTGSPSSSGGATSGTSSSGSPGAGPPGSNPADDAESPANGDAAPGSGDCTPTLGGPATVGADCNSRLDETCGGTDYAATCACPQGTCVCFGPTSTTVIQFSGCPACPGGLPALGEPDGPMTMDQVFSLCGFPH
jgi:hypothetical protein